MDPLVVSMSQSEPQTARAFAQQTPQLRPTSSRGSGTVSQATTDAGITDTLQRIGNYQMQPMTEMASSSTFTLQDTVGGGAATDPPDRRDTLRGTEGNRNNAATPTTDGGRSLPAPLSPRGRGGSSGGDPPADEFAVADMDLLVLQRQYDDIRMRQQVEDIEEVGAQLKQRERQLRRFYTDVTLPVTDDVGMLLGEARNLATELRSAPLDGLLDKLETAIEDQMYVLFTELRGGNDELANATDFGRSFERRALQRERRKSAITEKAEELERGNEEDGGVLSGAAPEAGATASIGGATTGRRSSTAASRRLSKASAATEAALAANVQLHPPAATGQHQSAGIPASTTGAQAALAATPYLFAESLAKTLRCERVRVYLAGPGEQTVQHATSFPMEPPAALPPALPRCLVTSVFHRGIAVSGYANSVREAVDSATLANLQGHSAQVAEKLKVRQKEKQAALAAASSGLPRCSMVFPIKMWVEGQERIVGVIECLDKEEGEDEVVPPGETMSHTPTSSNHGRRFTARDEALLLHATQLLAALFERYPMARFRGGDSWGAPLSGLNRGVAALTHLPTVVTADIPAAAEAGNRALRAPATTSIYRGAMSTVYRFSVQNAGEADPSLAATGQASPQASKGTDPLWAQPGSNDLRNVEESLDSLNAMWRKSYDDNVRMHQHCRRVEGQMHEMRRVTGRFEDAVAAGREMRSLEDLRDYLRTLELALRSGKVLDVDRVIDNGRYTAARAKAFRAAEERIAGHAELSPEEQALLDSGGTLPVAARGEEGSEAERSEAPWNPDALRSRSLADTTRTESARRRHGSSAVPRARAEERIHPAHIHLDGPESVRPYTVDPTSKRQQLEAIDRMVNAEIGVKVDDELLRQAAIPSFARNTENSKGRQPPPKEEPGEEGSRPRGAPPLGMSQRRSPRATSGNAMGRKKATVPTVPVAKTLFRLQPKPPPKR